MTPQACKAEALRLQSVYPLCGFCGVSVEDLVELLDPATGDYAMFARCHGQLERLALSYVERVLLSSSVPRWVFVSTRKEQAQ